jgi:hypothetical protein
MIVIEGPDGAGKTTLLNKLRLQFKEIPVAPRVVSKDAEAMVDLVEWVEENVERGWQNVFFDRHRLISEPIYGPILRSKAEPGFSDFGWFHQQAEEFYHWINPMVIYCLPPLSRVMGNLRFDPDNKAIVNYAEQIYSAYVAAAARDLIARPDRVVIWDFTQETQLMFKELVSQIQYLRETHDPDLIHP